MKLRFDPNQGFQLDAVAAVTDLFEGQPEYSVINLLDQTSEGRLLTAVFTIRGTLIRVISTRDMSRRERRRYEKEEEGG